MTQPHRVSGDGASRPPYGRTLLEFLSTEVGGGLVLLAAVALALAWANSPWKGAYERLWHTPMEFGIGNASIGEDLRHWINDALMAVFFFVVGLEIKRELVRGELNSLRKALVPALAALGGMLLPALIYLAFNSSGVEARGWGIPVATDIAFALGALALVAARAAPQLRVLLLSIAIVDDIGAIVVIAMFYSGAITWTALGVAAALVLGIVALRALRVAFAPLYAALGAGVWFAVFQSGVHATIAGVALGLLTRARPARRRNGTVSMPATDRLEHTLHPWTSYLVLPLFALANAGVSLGVGDARRALTSRVALGIVAGMVAGKTLGISGFTLLARRFGGHVSGAIDRSSLAGVAALGGIGFTLSLFVASLAFGDGRLIDEAKIGIVCGSLLSALLGGAILRAGRLRRGR
jgi:NhaA family Na+:H+ antiporter